MTDPTAPVPTSAGGFTAGPFEPDAFARAALDEQAARHRRRATALSTGLNVHVAVFVAVQLLLVAVWALGEREHPWFVYPLLGWGVGLVAHAVAVRSARST